MSLRDEAITHMAQAQHDFTQGWDDLESYREQAAVVLDALLQFLTGHTEEWEAYIVARYGRVWWGEPNLRWAAEVLRDEISVGLEETPQ